jgi:hypothetical protein
MVETPMDIPTTTVSISGVRRSALLQQTGNRVLRKALDIQQQSAQQLLAAVPGAGEDVGKPVETRLGSNVDQYA